MTKYAIERGLRTKQDKPVTLAGRGSVKCRNPAQYTQYVM